MINSPKRSKRRNTLLAVLLLGVGLSLSEIAVRLILPYNSAETIRAYSLDYEASPFTHARFARMGRLVEVDSDKAWGVKPADAESQLIFHINDLGFRGPSFTPRKPVETTRVFVIGGSAVFDQNVSDDQLSVGNSWPNRAQTLLEKRGFDIEVINAGTPGHTSMDALGRLMSEIWLYEPDIVLLYNGWNDIKHFRAFEITPEEPLSRLMRPFDPTVDPYRNHWGPWDRLLSHSQVYWKFRNHYLTATMAVGQEGWLPTGDVASTYGPFGPRQYELNLRNFVDMVRNMGARPILVTQGTLVLSPGDEIEGLIGYQYQLLDLSGLARAFEEVYRITRAVAREKSAHLLDAAATLNDPAYLTDHVHMSAAGSEMMAQLVADLLAEMLQESAGPSD